MKSNTCVICGNPCKQKTCGEGCRRLYQNKMRAARKRAVNADNRAKKGRTIQCAICGVDFVCRNGFHRKTCGLTECQDAYRRAYDIERYGRVKREFDCPVCGKHVETYRRSQITCGDACYNAHYGKTHEQELREKRREREQEVMVATYGMPCPWVTHKLDYLPHGVTSWDCAEMDPLGCGTAKVMLVINEINAEARAA